MITQDNNEHFFENNSKSFPSKNYLLYKLNDKTLIICSLLGKDSTRPAKTVKVLMLNSTFVCKHKKLTGSVLFDSTVDWALVTTSGSLETSPNCSTKPESCCRWEVGLGDWGVGLNAAL